MTDPEKTEDVEEWSVFDEVDEVEAFVSLWEKGKRPSPRPARDAIDAIRDEIRTLRERLEEVEEERLEAEHVAKGERQQADKYRRKMRAAQDDAAGYKADWIAARRRADRLEERVREYVRCDEEHGEDDYRTAEAFSRLRSALDSREDEGEDCTCGPPRVSTGGSLGGTLPDVDDRKDPECPVHADEPVSREGEGREYSSDVDMTRLLCEEVNTTALNGECPWHGGDACLVVYYHAGHEYVRPTHADARSDGNLPWSAMPKLLYEASGLIESVAQVIEARLSDAEQEQEDA